MFKTGTWKDTPDQTENTNSKKSRIESISKPHFLEMIKKFNLDPQEKKGKKLKITKTREEREDITISLLQGKGP